MRLIIHAIFMFIMIGYIGLAMLPAKLWYNPERMFIADIEQGEDLVLSYEGGAVRKFIGSYAVKMRKIENGQPVCDAYGGPYGYMAGAAFPEPLTMKWWAVSDSRCYGSNVPEGQYYINTCWTVHNVLRGLVPTKEVCIDSNVFTVLPEGALESKQEIQEQVEQLTRSLNAIQNLED